MRRGSIPRGIAIFGVALALGPGLCIPNNFDMVWRLAGVLVMCVGAFSLIQSNRQGVHEDED